MKSFHKYPERVLIETEKLSFSQPLFTFLDEIKIMQAIKTSFMK